LDLQDRGIIRKLILAGLVAAVIGFTAMALGATARFFPADTLFILLGMANATWIIATCLLVCREIEIPTQGSFINRVIRSMGRLALSHYPGHVWLGIIPVLWLRNDNMDMSFEASFVASLVYVLITGIVGYFWLKNHAQGPLEKSLRVLSLKLVRRN